MSDTRTPARRWGRGAAALGAGLALTLAACSGPTATPTTAPTPDGESSAPTQPVTISFSWWGNDERAALTEQAIDLFESQNPGVTVETQFSTIDAYITKLATQIASGSMPDLFLIPMESVKEYTAKGATTDLTPFIGSVIEITDIPETTQKIGQIDGTFYGFTLGTATNAFIYNPTVWKEAGAKEPGVGFTWEDLIDAGAKIRAASDGKTAAISDPGGWIAWFGTWLRQNGKQQFTDTGELGFTEQDLVDWWTLMEKLRDSGATTDAETTATIDQSMQNSGLARGLAAGEFAAASLTGAYADTLGADNVALAPLPSETDVLGLAMAGTNVAAISPKSPNQELTAKFLNFMINDPEAAAILGLTRGIPVNQANYLALQPTLEGGNLTVSQFVSTYADKFIDPDPLAPPGVSTLPAEFTLAYQNVMYGQLSVVDAAKAMYATYQAAIS